MKYLIRLVQVHESFRIPEIKALAALADTDVQVLHYSEQVRNRKASKTRGLATGN